MTAIGGLAAFAVVVLLIVAFVAVSVARVEQQSIEKRGDQRTTLDYLVVGNRLPMRLRKQAAVAAIVATVGVIAILFALVRAM